MCLKASAQSFLYVFGPYRSREYHIINKMYMACKMSGTCMAFRIFFPCPENKNDIRELNNDN